MTSETRYRCSACGNLTRFDVVSRGRTKAFWHYSLGGDLSIEDEEVLEREIERVECRWCGRADAIEEVPRVGGSSSEAVAPGRSEVAADE